MRAAFLVFALALVGLGPAFAKPPAAYNKAAGKSAPMEIIEEDYTTEDGRLEKRQVEKKPTLDRWGNAQQNQYDRERKRREKLGENGKERPDALLAMSFG